MTCQHMGCTCPGQGIERDGREYCSKTCADDEERTRFSATTKRHCDCGHPGCR